MGSEAMTAIETLERAIGKLEQLRDESPGEFDTEGFSLVFGVDGTTPEARLLVVMSRTVEPTLALLSKMLDAARATGEAHPAVLALARAILGEENDHDR